MSGERLINTDTKLAGNQTSANFQQAKKTSPLSGRVDINKLMFKVRKEENKQRNKRVNT